MGSTTDEDEITNALCDCCCCDDFENAYFTSETEAEDLVLMLRSLMANGEIEEEEIYITVGEMTEDGDYSAEEVLK